MRVWRKGRRVLGLQLCRVLNNCGSAWVFWRVVCRMRLSVYSQAFGHISTGVIHLRFPSTVLCYLGVSPLPCVSVWVRCRNAPCPGLFSP